MHQRATRKSPSPFFLFSSSPFLRPGVYVERGGVQNAGIHWGRRPKMRTKHESGGPRRLASDWTMQRLLADEASQNAAAMSHSERE